jgi:hypothetical protein
VHQWATWLYEPGTGGPIGLDDCGWSGIGATAEEALRDLARRHRLPLVAVRAPEVDHAA